MAADENQPPNLPELRPGKVGGKRDRNRRERTRQLLDSALAAFLERGIEAVTIDEIVRKAGMSKGSFYRYFDGKRQLVESLMAPLTRRLDTAAGACRDALSKAATEDELFVAYQGLAMELAGLLLTEPDTLRLYLQEARSPAAGARAPVREFADHLSATAIELTHVAHDRGLLRSIDSTVSALAVIGAAERLLFSALSEETRLEPLSTSMALISLVLDGVRPR